MRERLKLGGEAERRTLAVRSKREEFRAETEELEGEQKQKLLRDELR